MPARRRSRATAPTRRSGAAAPASSRPRTRRTGCRRACWTRRGAPAAPRTRAGACERAAREGRHEAEGWRLRKDGSRFWASAVIDAVRDETGRLVGFAKITRDITERRAAQEALRDSERQFRLLIAGVTDYGLYMLDP